jgi:hypothetical protein
MFSVQPRSLATLVSTVALVLLSVALSTTTPAIVFASSHVVFSRAFGSTELLPPILMISRQTGAAANVFSTDGWSSFSSSVSGQSDRAGGFRWGSTSITLEFDVWADVLPNCVVTFVHCDSFWREGTNRIINNPAQMRTTMIDWQQAPSGALRYTHRGRVHLPNSQVSFGYSGNWKAKLFDMSNMTTPLEELRFFVVEPLSLCRLDVVGDSYIPQGSSGIAAYTIEASIQAPPNILDEQLSRVVLYRNHRWFEQFVIDQRPDAAATDAANGRSRTMVFGVAHANKRFRIEKMPAQNEYRVLDVTSVAWFPSSAVPQRPLTPDVRRVGATQPADDGSMIALQFRALHPLDDDYVHLEFLLDPMAFPSRYDVYVVGSFNRWRVLPAWRMEYDASLRLYRLRQWVPRGRHNYMYATGRLGASAAADDAVNFEEFEGNTVGAANTIIAFYYYREPTLGGYERIIGIAGWNPASR